MEVRVKELMVFGDGTALKQGCVLTVHETLKDQFGPYYVCWLEGTNKDWLLRPEDVEEIRS